MRHAEVAQLIFAASDLILAASDLIQLDASVGVLDVTVRSRLNQTVAKIP
jgi:hypothetical protein